MKITAIKTLICNAHMRNWVFVRVETDGWSYVVDAFVRDAVPSAALLQEIHELGARVGELHAALAEPAQIIKCADQR